MAVLALVCTYNHTDKQHLIRNALWEVTNHFLDEQEKSKGVIGNIESMGLALQVWRGAVGSQFCSQAACATFHLLHRLWIPRVSFTPLGGGTVPRPSTWSTTMTTKTPWP